MRTNPNRRASEPGVVLVVGLAFVVTMFIGVAAVLKIGWLILENSWHRSIAVSSATAAITSYISAPLDHAGKLGQAQASANSMVAENFPLSPIGKFMSGGAAPPTVTAQSGVWDYANALTCNPKTNCWTASADVNQVNSMFIHYVGEGSSVGLFGTSFLADLNRGVTIDVIAAYHGSVGVSITYSSR